MGRSVPHNLKSTHQTEFVKIFNSLCGRLQPLGFEERNDHTRRRE